MVRRSRFRLRRPERPLSGAAELDGFEGEQDRPNHEVGEHPELVPADQRTGCSRASWGIRQRIFSLRLIAVGGVGGAPPVRC